MRLLDFLIGAIQVRYWNYKGTNYSLVYPNIYIGGIGHPKFKNYLRVDLLPEGKYIEIKYLDEGADLVNYLSGKKDPLLVYCNKGRGRSALIVAAYLVKYQSMKCYEAYRYLRNKRNVVYCTKEQLRSLRDYEKWISMIE